MAVPINDCSDSIGLTTQRLHKTSVIWTGGAVIINRFPDHGRLNWEDLHLRLPEYVAILYSGKIDDGGRDVERYKSNRRIASAYLRTVHTSRRTRKEDGKRSNKV